MKSSLKIDLKNAINRKIKKKAKYSLLQNRVTFIVFFSPNSLPNLSVTVLKNNGKSKDQSYPILLHDNMVFREDVDKANLFGTLLSETFKDNNTTKFDQNLKNEVEDEMKHLLMILKMKITIN